MMDVSETQRRALADMRRLLARFVGGHLPVREFVPQYGALFAPFDPPDLSTKDLSDEERAELDVFITLMGGWFGEDDERIPKSKSWVYGRDTEPYSWIDEPAYRDWIRIALAVATDVPGPLYHRDHRSPGDPPVARGRTTPGLAPGGGVIGSRSAAAG
jgi:hypothetical protein